MDFIKIINGSLISPYLKDHKFVKKFFSEMKDIRGEVLKLNPDVLDIVKKMKEHKKSPENSAFSYVYQTIENNILLLADEYLTKLNFNVDTLIYDGFLVRYDPNFNEKVLEDMNKYIYEKTKYDVKFIIKDMNEGYNLTEDDLKDIIIEDVISETETNSMKQIKDYFNNKTYSDLDSLLEDVKNKCKNTIYVFLNGAVEYIAIKKDYSHENDTKCMELSKFKTFHENYNSSILKYKIIENDKVVTKKISLPDAIDQISDLSYKGYFIKPYHPFENTNNNINGYLNIFSPMISKRLENYDVSKIEMILDHIKIVWANNDDFLYKYILSYFHQIIKTPWNKTQICMVLNGGMGIGKTLILEKMIKYMFGSNCGHQTQGLKSICAQFQGWIENKLLILAEEPTILNDMNFSQYEEKLKDFITAEKIEIEKKNIDLYKVDAYHNLIITCNHTKGIHIKDKKDRRFFILQCSDYYQGNTEYFKTLYDILDNKDNMDILFNYLYNYNDVVPLHPIPMTKIKKEMIDDNMSVYEKFLFHPQCRKQFDINKEIKSSDLYDTFTIWYDNMGFNKNFKPSNDKFFKEMSNHGKSKQVMKNKERYYKYEFNEETKAKINKLDEVDEIDNESDGGEDE